MAVLVVAAHDGKTVRSNVANAVTAASQMGPEVHVLVAGSNAGEARTRDPLGDQVYRDEGVRQGESPSGDNVELDGGELAQAEPVRIDKNDMQQGRRPQEGGRVFGDHQIIIAEVGHTRY